MTVGLQSYNPMKTQVLVYVPGRAVPHCHEVSPETTFEEIVVKLRGDGVITEDMIIVEEDGVEVIILTEKVGEGGRHKRVIHCHRCRHVHVTIAHPGPKPPGPLEHKFRPGTRVVTVKDWAVKQIPDIDHGAKWCLRDAAGEILDGETHIGTLAHHPGCALGLSLTEHHKPKG
jgi:hypothetical protein